MTLRVAVLAFLVVCYVTATNAQEECVPNPVYDIELVNFTLSWSPSDNCGATHYIVYIHSNGLLEHLYQVQEEYLEVEFLHYCREYTFSITAIGEDFVISSETSYDATIDISADTAIAISNFSGNQIDQDILFQWQVPAEYIYCARSYRLRIWDEDSDDPKRTIITSQTGYYLANVAQCMLYSIEISVQRDNTDQPIANFNYTVPAKVNNPSLIFVRQDTTTINTTWSLESYSLNRCPVNTLYVNSSRFIAVLPIFDIPSRPTIDVTLAGLKANSMYHFDVTVENSAGNSTAYQLAVQTHPIQTYSKNLKNIDVVEGVNEVEELY